MIRIYDLVGPASHLLSGKLFVGKQGIGNLTLVAPESHCNINKDPVSQQMDTSCSILLHMVS